MDVFLMMLKMVTTFYRCLGCGLAGGPGFWASRVGLVYAARSHRAVCWCDEHYFWGNPGELLL